MRSLFPVTPSMRYERMTLAIVASIICFILALQFGSIAMQTAVESPATLTFKLPGSSLLLFLFASTSSGFICLGTAFGLAAINKIQVLQEPRHLHLQLRIRAILLGFVRVAFAFAGLWVAANVALRFVA